MKLFFCLFGVFILTFGSLQAQSIEESLVTTSGANYTTEDANLEWAIGEPMVEFYNNSNANLDQGFFHSKIVITGLSSPGALHIVHVYPNPFTESVKVEAKSSSETNWKLYDAFGKLIYDQPVPESGLLNLSELQTGTYYLRIEIKNSENRFEEFKLIKLL